MDTGTKISAAVHGALLGWVLLAPVFRSEPLPMNVQDVSVITSEEFAAMQAARQSPDAATEIAVPEAQAPDLTGLADLLDTTFAAPATAAPEPARFTASDGLQLAYRDEGRRDGPVLLCLAGLTRNMEDFEYVARDVADRARIVRLDTRGRGASDRDANYSNYNLAREGQDALELLDHLGVGRAAILGTSRGGLVAMKIAATHGDRLTGVCLNDIGPEIDPAGMAVILGYLGVTPAFATHEAAADALVAANAARFPDVPRARWRRHAERIWTETGNRVRGAQFLRQAVAADPQDLQSLFYLARHRLEQRQWDEAIVLFHRALELTGGRGVDVVMDAVGKDTFEGSLDSLKPRGWYVTFGNASGAVDPIAPGELSRRGSLNMTRPGLFHFINTEEGLHKGAAALFGALCVIAFALIHRRISVPTGVLARTIDRIRAEVEAVVSEARGGEPLSAAWSEAASSGASATAAS